MCKFPRILPFKFQPGYGLVPCSISTPYFPTDTYYRENQNRINQMHLQDVRKINVIITHFVLTGVFLVKDIS